MLPEFNSIADPIVSGLIRESAIGNFLPAFFGDEFLVVGGGE
jgi:hypothetical protein